MCHSLENKILILSYSYISFFSHAQLSNKEHLFIQPFPPEFPSKFQSEFPPEFPSKFPPEFPPPFLARNPRGRMKGSYEGIHIFRFFLMHNCQTKNIYSFPPEFPSKFPSKFPSEFPPEFPPPFLARNPRGAYEGIL